MNHQRTRRRVAALILAAVAAAGCSSGSSDSSDDTTTDTTADEAVVETTTSPDTTVADEEPTTTVAAAGADVSALVERSPLALVRQVTVNDGYYTFEPGNEGKLPSEYRTIELSCGGDTCDELAASVSAPDGTTDDLTLTLEDGTYSGSLETMMPCAQPDGNFDGPPTSAYTMQLTLTPQERDGVVSHLSGTQTFRWVGEESADCIAEDMGFETEVFAFDPATAPLLDAADLDPVVLRAGYYGETAAFAPSDGGFRACEPADGEACDVVISRSISDVDADGNQFIEAFEIALTRLADGSYSGSGQYPGSCKHDVTGAFVTANGYDVFSDVRLRIFDFETPVVTYEATAAGTARADLTPEQAAGCGPFETDYRVAGVLSGIDGLYVGWTNPIRPVTQLGPVEEAAATTDAAASFDTGVVDGQVADAEMLVRFLTYTASLTDDAETLGLRSASQAAGLDKVLPSDPATPTAISAYALAVGPGMPFAVLDTAGTCQLGTIATMNGGRGYYMGAGDPASCTAEAALDAYDAGQLEAIS